MSSFGFDPNRAFPSSSDAALPKRSRVLLITGAILAVAGSIFIAIAGFVTDRMWFDSIGQVGVFDKLLITRVLLFVVGFLFAAALTALNVWVAYQSRPVFSPLMESTGAIKIDEVLKKLRQFGFVALPVVVGLLVGGSLAAGWQEWLQFSNAVEVGEKDVTFGMDLGFYLFK